MHSRTQSRRATSLAAASLFASLISPRLCHAAINVLRESVESYSACGFGDFPQANTDSQGFLDEILRVNHDGFVQGATNWIDPNVWDRDFCDSDLNSNCDDKDSFDPVGSNIAYFEGHGIDVVHTVILQPCTTWAQCTTPPAGASSPGVCVADPETQSIIGSAACPLWLHTCGSNVQSQPRRL
jgi:hypothetical protein